MTMKLSILITATERVTAPVRRISASISKMVGRGEKDVARLDRMMERLNRTAYGVGQAIGRTIRGVAIGAVAGTAALGRGVLATGMQFENFESTLSTVMKSSTKAKAAMGWIQDFAARTPFDLAEVTEAFVNLTNFGIKPTNDVMSTIGDTAAVFKGMGKSMDDVVQAIADAQNDGGFERLKEFGIKGSAKGGSVFLNYATQSGRVTKKVKHDADSIRMAILGIFNESYGGAGDKMSQTFSGRLSNLGDLWTGFKLKIAQAGVFDYVKGEMGKLITYLNSAGGKAKTAEWAKAISDGMISFGEALKAVDWPAVGKNIAAVASAAAAIGTAIATMGGGGLAGLFNMGIVGSIISTAVSLGRVSYALGLVSIAGAPMWAIVGVIAAIAAGAYLVWRNWDKVSAFFGRMWKSIKEAFVHGSGGVWNALPFWMKGILTGARFAINLVSGGSERPFSASGGAGGKPFPGGPRPVQQRPGAILYRQPGAAGGRAIDGKVRVAIDLRAPPGMQARTRVLSTSDDRVPVSIRRGAVMAGH